jgi:hypothetical protein
MEDRVYISRQRMPHHKQSAQVWATDNSPPGSPSQNRFGSPMGSPPRSPLQNAAISAYDEDDFQSGPFSPQQARSGKEAALEAMIKMRSSKEGGLNPVSRDHKKNPFSPILSEKSKIGPAFSLDYSPPGHPTGIPREICRKRLDK